MSAWRVCLDFGTAWSKAAAAPMGLGDDPSRVEPLAIAPEAANPFVSPCAVFIEGQRVLCGKPALEAAQAADDPSREALLSFKTLLSAGDIDALLLQQASRSVDPHQVFRQRDLIVLYLASFMCGVRKGLRAAGARPDDVLTWRYATPAWRESGAHDAHVAIVTLFAEADAVAERLGNELTSAMGAHASDAISALRAAASAQSRLPDVRPILEASAAAACHVMGRSDLRALVVLDMGAGTTDLGAVALAETPQGTIAEEIVASRRTLRFAGDLIDRLLMNIVIERSKEASVAAQSRQWRRLLSSIRDNKETLFLERKAVFRRSERPIVVHLRDLLSDKDFRSLVQGLNDAYRDSLDAAAAHAASQGAREVSATLAGGGAAAPFLHDMLKRAKPSIKGMKVRIEPSVPAWAEASRFRGGLAPLFPQLAIAMGGALAPEGLTIPASAL